MKLFVKRLLVLIIGAVLMFGVVGCGTSASFDEEYAQAQFDKQADNVTEEIGDAAERTKEQDEEIHEQAKNASENLTSDARTEFDKGLDSIDEWSDTGMSTSETLWYYALKAYYFLRELSPFLIAASWFVAIFLYIISVGNKAKRKIAVFGFGIAIPAVLLMIRFVVPWLMMLF